jgi:hypothetical protein
VWGNAGLASSDGTGTAWSLYNSSVTGQGGPSFTYSLDGGATTRHGVIRRPSSSISSSLRWESTTSAPDPVPAAFATDETYSTGYALPAGHQPDLCTLNDAYALICTGPRILGVVLSPACQPLPELHVPNKSWFLEPNPTRRAQLALQNIHAVEIWARQVVALGNTTMQLHCPTSLSTPHSVYQFWLTVERWTGTLCNRGRLHIPYKQSENRDDINFFTLERWARTADPNP